MNQLLSALLFNNDTSYLFVLHVLFELFPESMPDGILVTEGWEYTKAEHMFITFTLSYHYYLNFSVCSARKACKVKEENDTMQQII